MGEISFYTDKNRLFSEDSFSVCSPCMYRVTDEKYKTEMGLRSVIPSVKINFCEKDRRIAGRLVLDRSGAVPEIVGIAVSGDCRRQGIGKTMIQTVVESERLDWIQAQTDAGAIDFYRKCGVADERIVVEYPDGTAIRYNRSFGR